MIMITDLLNIHVNAATNCSECALILQIISDMC